MKNYKAYIAEFIGTLVLVFLGCGSAVVLGTSMIGGGLPIAVAFGFSVIAMAYVIGNISGCHINPAVSLAMLLRKTISLADFGGYVFSQVCGAIVGAGLLKLIVVLGASDLSGALGSNGISNAGGIWGALFVEILLTTIFVLVVLAITSDKNRGNVAGIIIGLTCCLVHIVGIPLTGTSINPARSIGPALFHGGDALKHVWVFIVAPLAGSSLAVLIFSVVHPAEKLLKKKRAK